MRDPFFIVGTGRCGSSMLRRILRSHADLIVPNETHWIPILHSKFGYSKVPGWQIEETIRSLSTGRGKSIIERICEEEVISSSDLFSSICGNDATLSWPEFHQRFGEILAARAGAKQWGDKTPDYGLCIDTIAAAWPRARFINLVRDGRDVAISMKKVPSFQQLVHCGGVAWQALAGKEKPTNFRADLIPEERFFDLWQRRVEITERLLSGIPASRLFQMRYEDLITSPADLLSEVADFLAVPVKESWITGAASEVRASNLDKNTHTQAFVRLTRSYKESIRWVESNYPRQAKQGSYH